MCGDPPYSDGTCAAGFVNNGGTCTRDSAYQNQCSWGGQEYDAASCECVGECQWKPICSPIVIDVLGNGFDLTDAANGTAFDIDNDGTPDQISWTSAASDDAWIGLDRDGDGLLSTGKELFGSVSPQEPLRQGEELNGFRSLAVYDRPGHGGNGDGKLTGQDSIFGSLKLWRDANHNGVSESCELSSLPELGLSEIDLDYRESGRIDQFGNRFRFRSKVRDTGGAQLGRWAWDVFLVVQQ